MVDENVAEYDVVVSTNTEGVRVSLLIPTILLVILHQSTTNSFRTFKIHRLAVPLLVELSYSCRLVWVCHASGLSVSAEDSS